MNTEIQKQLEQLAIERSIPFCYSDYIECPTGVCHKCGSDDLMRLLPSVGCEYGTDWIVEHILKQELTPVDTNEAFEESVSQCYPETIIVGWLTLDTISILKQMDPISWDIARSEWESSESEDGNILSFDNGSTYYWQHDLEELLR